MTHPPPDGTEDRALSDSHYRYETFVHNLDANGHQLQQ